MRLLSNTFLTAQKGAGVTGAAYDAIWKIVLSKENETNVAYDRTRITQIQHIEEEDNGVAEVLLQNSDAALNTPNFEQWQGIIYYGYNTGIVRSIWVKNTAYAVGDVVTPTTVTGYQYRCTIAGTSHATTQPTWGTVLGVTQTDGSVTWEMDGNTGDEYSPTAPLKVTGQERISSETQLDCRLYLVGIPNDMALDKAESDYTQESTDTNTCKDLIDAIAGATMAPFTSYTAYTVTYDSGYDDGIIDDFIPADYFSVSINDNRLAKIKELLNYTKCKMRIQADGAIHIFKPTLAGTTYAYEYRLAVATYHVFLSKLSRIRFVSPNKEIVVSHPDHETQYSGNSTSATSYGKNPKIHTTYRRLSSDAEAALMAAAIIERYELDAEVGSATVPMNCGQEIFDWVKITDGRDSGDERTGNVQYIQRNCKAATATDPGAFNMVIRFGRVNNQTIGNYEDLIAGGGIPQELIDTINKMLDDITTLYENQLALANYINQGVVSKWHVTQQLIIPVFPQ